MNHIYDEINGYIYDENNGHYIIKNATIQFPNFAGEEQAFNAAGRRNFRLIIPEELYNELDNLGVYVRSRPAKDDTEAPRYHVKVGVYPNSDVRIYSGKALVTLQPEDFGQIDEEYRKGHVEKVDVEFHVSVNRNVPNPTPYVRLDTAVITIGKSLLLDDYESDDELPFGEY